MKLDLLEIIIFYNNIFKYLNEIHNILVLKPIHFKFIYNILILIKCK